MSHAYPPARLPPDEGDRGSSLAHIGMYALDASALATFDLVEIGDRRAVYLGVKPSIGVRCALATTDTCTPGDDAGLKNVFTFSPRAEGSLGPRRRRRGAWRQRHTSHADLHLLMCASLSAGKKLVTVAMATTATAASILAFSCGDPIGATPADAEADGPAPDAGRRPPSDSGVEEPRAPEYDADGWLRIDVEPTRECPAYTPTRSDQMPPGIAWEPCAEPVLAVYPSCRRMKTDGPFNDRLNGFVVGGFTGMVDANGKALLAFGRHSANVSHRLVGEADGPIRHAVHTGGGPCQPDPPRLTAGRVLYSLYRTPDRGTQQGYRYGAIGGAFDEPAVVLEQMVDDYRRYSAGPDVFFDGTAFRAWAPDAPILSSIGERVDFDPGIFIGDAFFFRPNTGGDTHRVRIHQPGSGVRDFLWYGDEVASAAAYFGTDGKDMVWLEAFGRAHVGDDWALIDLVTAPYTTDPAHIEKRQLRSMETLFASPFVVGCGHTAPSSLVSGTRSLTRLSDGRFVMLEGILGDGGRATTFTKTLAITCEEIFVELMATFPDYSVARIRLDDFGLGDVPDGGR